MHPQCPHVCCIERLSTNHPLSSITLSASSSTHGPAHSPSVLQSIVHRCPCLQGVVYSTGPHFLNSAWIAWRRETRACRRLGLFQHVEVRPYRDIQPKLAVHHWFGNWQPQVAGHRKASIGRQRRHVSATYDEGLLDWMGVERQRECSAARLDNVLNQWRGSPLVHYKLGSDAFELHEGIGCRTKANASLLGKAKGFRRQRRWRCSPTGSSGRLNCIH